MLFFTTLKEIGTICPEVFIISHYVFSIFQQYLIIIQAKLAEGRCPGLCAETLFVLLPKFGAVLSIICGFLVAVYSWIHLLQCIDVVQSFLRMLKLHEIALCKLYLLRGSYSVSQCVRTLNLDRNIPLNFQHSNVTLTSHLKT